MINPGGTGNPKFFSLNHIDALVAELDDTGHTVAGGINRSHRIFRIIEQQFMQLVLRQLIGLLEKGGQNPA